MGVTIHFEGRLKNDAAFQLLLDGVEEFARQETLLTEKFTNREVRLSRVSDEVPCDYVGPSKGIILYLHEYCEPLRLEFDRDLYAQNWVKTQFAGVGTHIKLICVLRNLAPLFQDLKVNDEGEYWDTADQNLLTEHMNHCDNAIAQLLDENPTSETKVREADGRITDIILYRK